ncbi:uncharacterized protein Nmag_2634 [Natrialba magadii ATCC 43099]|uniref:DUF4350 domain-containing protein n=1 Tax=Natrialba magadii (strain ATCC 43099 / DSM 3394 / CCM 3739 / CIP 104546 / IAM 13178 / JCM 8861 / NBRC 102185 / NCIMB 2190 / MS3) TaxID=547559 RepID=D3SZ01_NATMM|nr:DUF4350 domain-containing protein [Natrialba magadii]ADD06193.1 uncharacterized protein Nmag_2634 [Natrialba magadii ATCC 43099]ELY30808.1 hypothetical protein C500_07218 [Natrialba magadii ATCC 43099]
MSAGNDHRTRLALFVTIVVLSVAAVTAAGFVTDQGQTAKPTVDQAHFQPDAVDVDELDRGGEIALDSTGSQTILIDVAHGNGISEADLQPVVSALTAAGHTVQYHELEDEFAENDPADLRADLQEADAFIVAEPTQRYTTGEAEAVADFADAGGRVMFAAGPGGDGVGALVDDLLGGAAADAGGQGEFAAVTSPLGIAYGTGYLYDMDGPGTNYRTIDVSPAAENDLTDGVDQVVLDGPTQVASEGQSLLETSETAEHSESRDAGVYSVAVQHDNTVAVGDTGFMSSQNYNVADNEVFIANLLEFLVGGQKEPGAPSAPDDADEGADDVSAPEQGEFDPDGAATSQP